MNASLADARSIYIVGIKGTGMTALAQVLHGQGKRVEGSDTAETFFTDDVLRRNGIAVHEGFSATNLPQNIDVVLHSTAYTEEHEEVREALRRGLPVLTYPQALGELFRAYEGISITGSHGKTTVTAMVGSILLADGRDPTVIVGAPVTAFHGNALVGHSRLFVAETDEYQNKFTQYSPRHLLVTNIDYDHPDFFSSAEAYRDTFKRFIEKLPGDGVLVTNAHNRETVRVLRELKRSSTTFGREGADASILSSVWEDERQQICLRWKGEEHALALHLPGFHNAENAAAAFALCASLGVVPSVIVSALEAFQGATRRFQLVGTVDGAPVIDDFAHHPTEIAATIAATRQRYPGKRILTVFHPHTYSRTKALLDAFAAALTGDVTIVIEVYGSSREKERTVSSRDLVEKLRIGEAHYTATIEDAAALVRRTVKPDDLLLLLGAGDAWKLAGLLKAT